MCPGASKDWRQVLKKKTGETLSARAMYEYFQPLMEYLKAENENYYIGLFLTGAYQDVTGDMHNLFGRLN